MSTHRFILEPYKGVSTLHTCPNCHCKDVFQSILIRRNKSSSQSTWDVVTMSRNAAIIPRLVITLSRIRQRKKGLQRIVSGAMPLLRKRNQ